MRDKTKFLLAVILYLDLETLVNPEVKSRVDFHVNHSRESVHTKCKSGQIQKLAHLTEKSKTQNSKGMIESIFQGVN